MTSWKKLFYSALIIYLFVSSLSLLPAINESNARSQVSLRSNFNKVRLINFDTETPNVVSAGMVRAVNDLGEFANDATEHAVFTARKSAIGFYEAMRSAGEFAVSSTGETLYFTLKYSAKAIGISIRTAGIFMRSLAKVFASTAGVFRKIIQTPAVHAYVRPAEESNAATIDVESAIESYWKDRAEKKEIAAPSRTEKIEHSEQDNKQWPIHGQVTTLFGVPHWPFQPTHTGIDISSGQRSGVIGIKPFRTGRVVETVISSTGLGNHVIVDHGDGLTSVYAHLYAINTEPGQDVDMDTIIGYEGSTGASTGTHLHFEIRRSGQSIDPNEYMKFSP